MSEQIQEKYLPIGTVVMLKGGKKRVMITGFCIVPEDDQNKMYDYLGCIYPEGALDPKQGLMFNHNQIEKIYHMGLIDDEEQEFKKKLKELLDKMQSESNSNPELIKLDEE